MLEPKTDKELAYVVNLAEVMLRVDSARDYGLIRGGPKVNAERCVRIIARGKDRGIRPDETVVEAMTLTLGLCL